MPPAMETKGAEASGKPSTPTKEDSEPQPVVLVPATTTTSENATYPEGARLFLMMASVFVSIFLIALDRLIISTAVPEITNEFRSVTDIGWYGSAYLITNCAFQLLFGKLYTFFSIKGCFLVSVLLFEVGSAICGAAPSSVVFIIGRAIAGLGSAGIMSGAFVIVVYAVPLHKRPMYQGMFGAVFGISSILGPVVGGAFTTRVTWRWCFYINLPFGAATFVFIAALLTIPDRDETKLPLKDKILQLDLLGTAALLPGTVCLLLALQWGGSEYPWKDGRIVALLVLAGILLIAFVLVQVFTPKTATITSQVVKQRSIIAGIWVTLCNGASMMIFVFFIPIWFQAIRGESALDSGIKLLPICLPLVAASIVTGGLVTRIGYYTPFLLGGCVFLSIGAGLITTFQVDTPNARSVGYQVVYGWGLGMVMQAPNLAAQAVLSRKDAPVGMTLIIFTQLLGGAIFISVSQNVFNSQLIEQLSGLPGFDPSLLRNLGATTLIAALPEGIRGDVLRGYNEALRKVFQVGLVMTCLAILGAAAMEWISVKKDLLPKGEDQEKGPVEGEQEMTEQDMTEKDMTEQEMTEQEKKGAGQEKERMEQEKKGPE